MDFLRDVLYDSLKFIVDISIILFEYVGTLILIVAGIKAIYNLIHKKHDVRLKLAEGVALSLEFKLGGEILRTLIVREFDELYMVAGIIVLRIAITFLVHWEIQGETPKRKGHINKLLTDDDIDIDDKENNYDEH